MFVRLLLDKQMQRYSRDVTALKIVLSTDRLPASEPVAHRITNRHEINLSFRQIQLSCNFVKQLRLQCTYIGLRAFLSLHLRLTSRSSFSPFPIVTDN